MFAPDTVPHVQFCFRTVSVLQLRMIISYSFCVSIVRDVGPDQGSWGHL